MRSPTMKLRKKEQYVWMIGWDTRTGYFDFDINGDPAMAHFNKEDARRSVSGLTHYKYSTIKKFKLVPVED